MTAKERGQYIKGLLSTLTPREERVLRLYFGIKEHKRNTLEEIGKGNEVSREQIKKTKNKGVIKFRNRIIQIREIVSEKKQGSFFDDKERLIKICDKLREYVERVNQDLVYKEVPYHYSEFLDEFMLTMIDGVDWSGHYRRKSFL